MNDKEVKTVIELINQYSTRARVNGFVIGVTIACLAFMFLSLIWKLWGAV